MNLPQPLSRVATAPVARGKIARPGPLARVFSGPRDFSPALAAVATVNGRVGDVLAAGGSFFHPAAGFAPGTLDRAPADVARFLKAWEGLVAEKSGDFAAEWAAKDYENYERLSAGILWGAVAGVGLGELAELFGYGSIEGVSGSVAESLVRFAAGNGDTIGGLASLHRGRDAEGESDEEVISPVFREALARGRAARGLSEATEDDGSSAHSFAWGALAGWGAGPVTMAATQALGFDKSGSAGALYASLFSNADNAFGAVGAFCSLYRRQRRSGMESVGAFREAWREFSSHPFQVANAAFILAAFGVNVGVRASGVLPVDDQVAAAIEGAALNLDSVVASLWTKTRIAKLRQGLVDSVSDPETVGGLWSASRA